jgi:hypothetical protein
MQTDLRLEGETRLGKAKIEKDSIVIVSAKLGKIDWNRDFPYGIYQDGLDTPTENLYYGPHWAGVGEIIQQDPGVGDVVQMKGRVLCDPCTSSGGTLIYNVRIPAWGPRRDRSIPYLWSEFHLELKKRN